MSRCLRLFCLGTRNSLFSLRSSFSLALLFTLVFWLPYLFRERWPVLQQLRVCLGCGQDLRRTFYWFFTVRLVLPLVGLALPTIFAYGWRRGVAGEPWVQGFGVRGEGRQLGYLASYVSRLITLGWLSGIAHALAFFHYRRLGLDLPQPQWLLGFLLSWLAAGVALAFQLHLQIRLKQALTAYLLGSALLLAGLIVGTLPGAAVLPGILAPFTPYYHVAFLTSTFTVPVLRTAASALILVVYITLLLMLSLNRLGAVEPIEGPPVRGGRTDQRDGPEAEGAVGGAEAPTGGA
jgi:hypothetical protein